MSLDPKVPENADYVMYWWEKAALATRKYDRQKGKGTRRFGLITTNSIKQSFNRAVTSPHLNDTKAPLSLLFAIPDHPWIDASDGAAVRIAMSVGAKGQREGRLAEVVKEVEGKSENEGAVCEFATSTGMIFSNFRLGADLLSAFPLQAMDGLACVGYQLTGKGFLIEPARAKTIATQEPQSEHFLKPWLGGLSIQRRQDAMIAIDVCHVSIDSIRASHPIIYQHLSDNVLPERKENSRKSVRERWWVYGEARNTFRPALQSIDRMIVTSLTASNRIFVFEASDTIADSTTVMFALDAGEHLAVMSSRTHLSWVSASGGTLEDRPRYNKSRCFDPFPFPDLTNDQKSRLRLLGEEMDAHRKRQQAAHPKLTLTNMYNVLEKLRAGKSIKGKDREIYDQGLIGILKELHDQIDAEVAEAYGWPLDINDRDILFRLVALNKERAEEEARGHISWLRPDYQNPTGAKASIGTIAEMDLGPTAKIEKAPWPQTLPDQIAAVRYALAELGDATAEQIARRFLRARTASVQPLLESLAALGQAEKIGEGRFAA